MSVRVFAEMLGVAFDSVVVADDNTRMAFTIGDRTFTFYHSQDCCESVAVEDVCGDIADLVGSPLVTAEEVDSDDAPAPPNRANEYGDDSHTWTFYRFATAKGAVTVRWLGESNGYYSEQVYFSDSDPAACFVHEDCRTSRELGVACARAVDAAEKAGR